ncbi:Lon protease family protein [Candidatus Thorarchaeota archaeon]|nr:MAG: Lon protease family protein [Candidatus Thorarchaeota archaeon]
MRLLIVTTLLDGLETTKQVLTSKDPFQRIIGQEHAVTIVQSAVKQRRHVLLCGVPGIGKSMLAKAAYSLLDRPTQEIQLKHNKALPDRPIVVISHIKDEHLPKQTKSTSGDVFYSAPDRLPIEIAIKMGYRCPKCISLSVPSEPTCTTCGTDKRCDWSDSDSYHGLFRMLDVVRDPALRTVTDLEEIGNESYHILYERSGNSEIAVTRERLGENSVPREVQRNDIERILVGRDASRFVRVSGASHVELLGDVKHDPYGSAEALGMAAYQRVIPGAIHEAHEGILYIDEISALGPHQSHLLTAMQERNYPISGHNPLSSGASVRVDNVPCDFILFASCNTENISGILPALRSRIRGYGYEIMLASWTKKSQDNLDDFIRFIAQTIEEDGKVPHFSVDSVSEVLRVAEKMALQFDGQRDALTLRLRELGGLVRIAGDLAVQDDEQLVQPNHVKSAEVLIRGIDMGNTYPVTYTSSEQANRDYFF